MIVCDNKKGLLAAMSSAIASSEANITNAHVRTAQDGTAVNTFEIEVSDLKHLQNIMDSLRTIKGVIKVERLKQSST
jgi:GTP pyrophosphokinase